MELTKVKIRGFRNFKDATIRLNQKSLIIGSNDIGKTNFFHALRILLDRGFSDYDLEPKDSDFYVYEEVNEYTISLYFENVTEDCVVAKLKGRISDNDKFMLRYQAFRDPDTKAKHYKLWAGPSLAKLEEIEDRFYRKVLNVKYISSRRDFHAYISREKNHLLETAKANRNPEQITQDDLLYEDIRGELQQIDKKIPDLHFISSATSTINEELKKLSLHHGKQEINFDASTSNVDAFINNVSISSHTDGKSILIGGDGRLNQIYLALWASRNQLTEDNLREVTIFCIEEPEAHLHPHQQRKLADYLNVSIAGQVLISSHSPQIASEFSPNSIVRLHKTDGAAKAASDGCSAVIGEAFEDFGYRMSIIPAEAFFADVVFLVEGPSEQLFYKTLATQLGIDLDHYNISILMVDGIGFNVFAKILEALKIEWVMRTDNDIFKLPKKDLYTFAGIRRGINAYRNYYQADPQMEKILKAHEVNIREFPKSMPDPVNIKSAAEIRKALEPFNIFLSEVDLENDIYNSKLKKELETFFDLDDKEEILKAMTKNKAIFMYRFIKKNKAALPKLKDSPLAAPLHVSVKLAQEIHK
ncbi:AAA family ATPase [Flavobacterium zhairuonense]|uniref:ATP-dependent nuclease n=1 Tax=Flavobacterium zhairuonense TaxID=2493631 RepID=UPI00104594A4|nr:AAA family ATPase [Flavobacterium zhairuonense]KAF2508719.1 AAA family ATPase [Flavobacterium zhairuonense]